MKNIEIESLLDFPSTESVPTNTTENIHFVGTYKRAEEFCFPGSSSDQNFAPALIAAAEKTILPSTEFSSSPSIPSCSRGDKSVDRLQISSNQNEDCRKRRREMSQICRKKKERFENIENENHKLEKKLEYLRGRYENLKECHGDLQTKQFHLLKNIEETNKKLTEMMNQMKDLRKSIENIEKNTKKI